MHTCNVRTLRFRFGGPLNIALVMFPTLVLFLIGLHGIYPWVLHPASRHWRGLFSLKKRLVTNLPSTNTAIITTTEPNDKAASNFMFKFNQHLERFEIDKLLLSKPRDFTHTTALVPDYLQNIQSVTGRYLKLQGSIKYQLSYKYKTNLQVRNYGLADVTSRIKDIVESGAFKTSAFCTSHHRHQLDIKLPPGESNQLHYRYKVETIKPPSTLETTESAPMSDRVQAHDRPKNVLVPVESPFLEALGITCKEEIPHQSTGRILQQPIIRPRVGMADKLGQIQKFVEILDTMVSQSPELRAKAGGNLTIVDMGSGLAYLTFATHVHFRQRYPGLLTCGVERRPDLCAQTNAVARQLGSDFEGLHFQATSIHDAGVVHPLVRSTSFGLDTGKETSGGCPNVNRILHLADELNNVRFGADKLDILIALHACDTATDDAILHGIRNNASLIVVSPCCHKELRPQLDQYESRNRLGSTTRTEGGAVSAASNPLAEVLVHGIYRERHAEMLTDTLRALCLQYRGYDTKIFEFVGGNHTAKNTMIAATKRSRAVTRAEKEKLWDKIQALMGCFGITSHYLVSAIKE